MKYVLLAPVGACSLLLAVACSGGGRSDATAVPLTIPVAITPVSASGAPINSGNATGLVAVSRGVVESPQGLTWRPDSSGVLVYTNSTIEGLAAVSEAPLDRIVASLPEDERIVALNAQGDGSFLTLAGDRKLALRDLRTSAVLRAIELDVAITNARFAPDGSEAILQHADEVAVDVVSMPDGGKIKTLTGFDSGAPVYSVRYSSDGKWLIWQSRTAVQVMEIESGKAGALIGRHELSVAGVALWAGEDEVRLASAEGSRVHLWDPQTGNEHAVVPLDSPGLDLAFSPDGKLLAMATSEGTDLLEAGSLNRVASLAGVGRLVAFSPDGRALATIDEAGEVVIWRVAA